MDRRLIAVTHSRHTGDMQPSPGRSARPAKVKLAPIIEEIHGTMYDLVFKTNTKGEMIVTKKPDMSKVKWSKAQKANRQPMSKATTQVALMDTKVRAKYERKAQKQGRRAWNLALSDCLQRKDLRSKRCPPASCLLLSIL
jgi:hypothetical protein